jgi:hypothetical protein
MENASISSTIKDFDKLSFREKVHFIIDCSKSINSSERDVILSFLDNFISFSSKELETFKLIMPFANDISKNPYSKLNDVKDIAEGILKQANLYETINLHAESIIALGYLQSNKYIDAAANYLKYIFLPRRDRIIECAGEVKNKTLLNKYINDLDLSVRNRAIRELTNLGDNSVLKVIQQYLFVRNGYSIIGPALASMYKLDTNEALTFLHNSLEKLLISKPYEGIDWIITYSIYGLQKINSTHSLPILMKFFKKGLHVNEILTYFQYLNFESTEQKEMVINAIIESGKLGWDDKIIGLHIEVLKSLGFNTDTLEIKRIR